MDDSDGVAGSAAVNSIEPTLTERILQYELSGRKPSVYFLVMDCIFTCHLIMKETTVMQQLVMRELFRRIRMN